MIACRWAALHDRDVVGEVLMFFRQGSGSPGPQLYSIDVTGRNEQRIQTPNFGSDPAWSPLLD